MKTNIADRVRGLVVERLGVEKEKVISSAKFIEDLVADSLDLADLKLSFDNEFVVQIRDNKEMATVGDVIDYITTHYV